MAQPQPGAVLWTYDVGVTICASPAVGPDGTIYVGTGSTLYALTNSSRSLSNKWVFAVPLSGGSPAVGYDNMVYVCSGLGNLHAINPDGSQKWSYAAGCGKGSPAIGPDGTVYIGGSYLYAISPSGAVKWKAAASANSCSSPAVGPDGSIYVGSYDASTLYAFSPDGVQRWSASLGYEYNDSPAFGAAGTVYASGRDLFAFNPDGTQLGARRIPSMARRWWTPGEPFTSGAELIIFCTRLAPGANFFGVPPKNRLSTPLLQPRQSTQPGGSTSARPTV